MEILPISQIKVDLSEIKNIDNIMQSTLDSSPLVGNIKQTIC